MKPFAQESLWFVILWSVISVFSSHVMANVRDDQNLISITMMMGSEQPVAGSTQALALIMKPQKGWHGYWRNPGDAGFPARFNWQLPTGLTVGEVQYPAPSQLVISDMMNYIYHGTYVLLAPISIDKSIAVGTQLTISLDISYLACDPTTCLPEQQTIETSFIVGKGIDDDVTDGDIDKQHQSQFNQWRQQLPKPIAVKGQFTVANDQFTLTLPLPSSIDTSNAHIYPAINNTIVNNARQTLTHASDMLTMRTQVGEEPNELFQGVLVLNNGIALSFDADKTDHIAFATMAENNTPSAKNGSWLVAIMAVFGAILGGLLLNIMPCVFPILSLKILSLSHQTSEKDTKLGAIAYTLGAVLVCVILGGVILGVRLLGHQVGWAFQLQSPAVIAGLIILMSAIGFNLAGLFEIGTLTSGSKLQDKKGPIGDFWTGVLAAFIATPCTGPFMATALGAALVLPVSIALLIFSGLGFGMALPFLLVSFIPTLRTRLPKPGMWMITARRILSVPMFLTALGLVWILMRQSNNDYVLSVLGATMLSTFGLWLTGLWQQSQHKGTWRPALALTILPFIAVVYWVPNTHIASQIVQKDKATRLVFNADKLNELRLNQDVFLYFTADWCLTCKVNEKTSIDREDVTAAFKQNNVAVMVGDWTNSDSEITTFLAQHNRSGVPLYLWYKKAVDNPMVLSQILSPTILIEQAKSDTEAF
jgi:thiol:disulfide interchange protein